MAAAPSGVWPLINRFSQSAKQLPQFSPFVPVQATGGATSNDGQASTWEWDTAFGSMAWQIRFTFGRGGNFIFAAHALDVGHMEARGGKWTATSEVLQRQSQGNYYFVGANSLVMTGSIRGALASKTTNTLWERLGTTNAAPTSATSPLMEASGPPLIAAAAPSPSPTASPLPTATPAGSPTATPAPPPIEALDRHFLISHESRVYAHPDSSSEVVGHVHRGRYVHITGLTGNWLRVTLPDATVGFIPDRSVE